MPAIQSSSLTNSEVAFYNREGYLICDRPIFSESKFSKLREHFEEKLRNYPKDQRPEGMDVPHFTDTKLFEWLLSDEILDLVEPILGPDLALFSSHFICKPSGDGKRVPWHEDSAYWKGMFEPIEVCTVWLAIDSSTQENGCMKVIPRTHDHGYSDYEPVDPSKNVFGTEILASQRDTSKAVPIELQPNQASLHDGRLMHASDANTSTARRCGYTMRYVSTATRFNQERDGHRHQFYLARGKDRAGNRYGDPTKNYPDLVKNRGNRRGH